MIIVIIIINKHFHHQYSIMRWGMRYATFSFVFKGKCVNSHMPQGDNFQNCLIVILVPAIIQSTLSVITNFKWWSKRKFQAESYNQYFWDVFASVSKEQTLLCVMFTSNISQMKHLMKGVYIRSSRGEPAKFTFSLFWVKTGIRQLAKSLITFWCVFLWDL